MGLKHEPPPGGISDWNAAVVADRDHPRALVDALKPDTRALGEKRPGRHQKKYFDYPGL
jgi:hypothetical protein